MIGSNQSPGEAPASPPAEPSPAEPSPALPVEPMAAPAPPAPRRPGIFRRAREWFWRGRTLAELKQQGRITEPRAQDCLRQGWVCAELAERALRPVPRVLAGATDGPARELAREAVTWALLAERALRADGSAPASADGADLLALWAAAPAELLANAAGGEGAAHAVQASLAVAGFVDFAALSAEEQARQARDLAVFARTLLANVEAPRVRLDRIYLQRFLRSGGLLFLLVAVAVAAFSTHSWNERQRDIARGRPYRTSSVYTGVGCHSPDQDCPESPFFFFHTLEDDRPWVEIDLGGKRKFSAIKIVNREDCCGERAVPLAVEVSNDRKTWREVARREDTFNTWYAEFPTVSAHYVRAISLHKTLFHLRRFSVLR
ncbi:MAG TPA: discoidin domain-containing protein [Polyangiaceae bacterium]|nr:discoidin domain-containing protein [Polyangiaceae bacterium]